jgi:hypothetical protein
MLLVKLFIWSLLLLVVLIILTRLVGLENTLVDYIILLASALLGFVSKKFRQYSLVSKIIWVIFLAVIFFYSFFWILWVVFNNAI